MVNINLLLNHIKARLGASHRQLELSDDAIVECLQQETLLTLSAFMPYYGVLQLDLTDDNRIMPNTNTYFMPEEIQEHLLMDIVDVIPTNMSLPNQSYFFTPTGGDMQTALTILANTRLANTLASAMVVPSTWQFIPPNMLRLDTNYALPGIITVAKVTHKKDFTTFPIGALETIKKLAYFDVCMDIYGIRKYFQNINTLVAQINLNIDEFSSIPDKRDELVEKLRREQLKYSFTKKIYFG